MYEGKLIRLRGLKVEDAEICSKWFGDLELGHNLNGGAPRIITPESEREWILNAMKPNPHEQQFAIETLDGEYLGNCSYMNVNFQARNCMVGWYIGDSSKRGRGYGSDMIITLLNVCFNELNMHRAFLHVFGYNTKAVKLYERIGFVREGTFRDQAFAMGRYWDEYQYAMLDTEFQEKYGDYFAK